MVRATSVVTLVTMSWDVANDVAIIAQEVIHNVMTRQDNVLMDVATEHMEFNATSLVRIIASCVL